VDPEDERFDAKVRVVIESVRRHVREEESEYFREVRSELGTKALNELGDAMAKARETAPTRPHPRLPDTPPGNLVAGMAVSVIDHVLDSVSGVMQGSVAAVQGLIDRVRGNEPRRGPRRGPARHAERPRRCGAGRTLPSNASSPASARQRRPPSR
jgi:hypothetical protein